MAAEAAVGVVGRAQPVLGAEGVLERHVAVGESDAVGEAHGPGRQAERPVAGVDRGRAAAGAQQQVGRVRGQDRRANRRGWTPVYE